MRNFAKIFNLETRNWMCLFLLLCCYSFIRCSEEIYALRYRSVNPSQLVSLFILDSLCATQVYGKVFAVTDEKFWRGLWWPLHLSFMRAERSNSTTILGAASFKLCLQHLKSAWIYRNIDLIIYLCWIWRSLTWLALILRVSLSFKLKHYCSILANSSRTASDTWCLHFSHTPGRSCPTLRTLWQPFYGALLPTPDLQPLNWMILFFNLLGFARLA